MTALALEPAPFDFPGGVAIDPEPPAGTGVPGIAALPERLFLPVNSNDRPLVRIGDRVLAGQRLTEGAVYSHAPTSGRFLDVVSRPAPNASGRRVPSLVLSPDGHEEAVDPKPWQGATADIDADELIRRVREAGVVGMGGAGFPTHRKLDIARTRGVHTLIVNAVECEPGVTADAALLRIHADEVLRGAAAIAGPLDLRRVLVGVDGRDAAAVGALLAAWTTLRGNVPAAPEWRLYDVPPRYPAGSERSLVRALLGIPLGGAERPTDRGVICCNAATLFAVCRAVRDGEPSMRRLVSMTGDRARQPGDHWVRHGHPVGALATDAAIRIVSGGRIAGQQVDAEVSVTKATLALEFHRPAERIEQPCIRCQRCTTVCPELLRPERLLDHARARDAAGARREGLDRCIECGACDVVCPSGIGLLERFRAAKAEHRRAAIASDQAAVAQVRYQRHQQRAAAQAEAADAARLARRRRRRLRDAR